MKPENLANRLYEKLIKHNQKETVANFLLSNDSLRHVVRRAFIVEKFPYSEIQDNTIGASLVPIDMLRLKLSFFGAVKFDPRSDKWLRINMYQGAPLPHEKKFTNDSRVYNSLNKICRRIPKLTQHQNVHPKRQDLPGELLKR